MRRWREILFSARGRVSRMEFWLANSVRGAFIFVLLFVALYLEEDGGAPLWAAWVCAIALYVGLFYFGAVVGMKRLRDIGRPVWWYVVSLVPFIGPPAFLIGAGLPKSIGGRLESDKPDPA